MRLWGRHTSVWDCVRMHLWGSHTSVWNCVRMRLWGVSHFYIHVETTVGLGCSYSGADCLVFETDSLTEPGVQDSAKLTAGQ